MIGVKRFVRPDVIYSAIGHVGILVLGLLFFGAGTERPRAPEAMAVEIVPPSEAPPPPQIEQQTEPQTATPHVEGTALESKTNGSEASSDSDKGSASAESSHPKMALSSSEQAQHQQNPQRTASLAATEPKAAAPPQEPQPETQPDASEPILPPKPNDEPNPEEAKSEADIGNMFAMPLTLPGGQVGGGLDAPSAKPAMAPHDDTAAFRAHVSSCSHLPRDIGLNEKVMIVLRVSFNRDGTLASEPEMLDATFTPKASVLMQSAVSALQKCQPFTELPKDKYKEWKTLDLVVTPTALSGG